MHTMLCLACRLVVFHVVCASVRVRHVVLCVPPVSGSEVRRTGRSSMLATGSPHPLFTLTGTFVKQGMRVDEAIRIEDLVPTPCMRERGNITESGNVCLM